MEQRRMTIKPRQTARDFQKAKNRELLLAAAKKAICLHGIKGTTVDVVQNYSGLGRGMINQHFGSKSDLIWAVAEALMAQYQQVWQENFSNDTLSASEKLIAICNGEFTESILSKQSVSIWFAFRSESSTSAKYHDLIGSGDRAFTNALYEVCKEICAQAGQADGVAQNAARALSAVMEGLWTEFHLDPENFDRDEARALCIDIARKYMPTL